MIMAQNEYEKIVKAMADKGVPHWAFELLADLRHNEVMNSRAVDGAEFKGIYRARDKFAHLDRVVRDCATSDDPIYKTASALWDAGAKRKQGDVMMEERELACVNEKCQYNDHTFDQNCAAMIKDAGAPYLPYCKKYIAEGTNEMKKVYCVRCCFRDKHGDLESVTKLNFGLFEDKKVAQVVVDALNRPLKDSWELKRKGEIENIELEHKQWSPDNAEVFYEVVG